MAAKKSGTRPATAKRPAALPKTPSKKPAVKRAAAKKPAKKKAAKKAVAKPDFSGLTAAEVADIFDVSPQYLAELARRDIIHKRGRGEYDFIPSVRGYVRHLKNKTSGSGAGDEGGPEVDSNSWHAQRARLTKAKADQEIMKADEMAGNLTRVEEINEHWERIATTIRTRLLAIPSKLAATVVIAESPSEANDLMMEEIREALEELAGNGNPDRVQAGDDVLEESETAAEPDDVAMGG